jgi:hypothetical protein
MARTLTFRIDTIGDSTTASTRLRAWKLAEFLKEIGHQVLLNEGDSCDVYVCQKTRPFESLQRFKAAGALAVYDLDDHFLLAGPAGHGLKEEVVAFFNAVDVVTVGNQHLLRAAENYHPQVFCLENPLDLRSTELVRRKTAELKRIGWFGTPAGLVQLDTIDTTEVVETITRGGDIEFDLETIDSTLIRFDLLVLPVTPDEWNLAKNANRMMKAVALGVPVLASAVPEHIGAAKRFGVDDRFLVREGESWAMKIDELRRAFDNVQECILNAREEVLKQVCLQRIGQNWLAYVERMLANKANPSPGRVPATKQLSDCAIIVFSHRSAAAASNELGGTSFGGKHQIPSCPSPPEDFLKRYGMIWEAVQSENRDWIVLLPDGFALAFGFAEELTQARAAHPGRNLFVIRSHKLGAPPDDWGAYVFDLRETICHPRDPGVVVARREWLLKQPWRPADSLSYWTWLLVVEALNERTLGVVYTPVTWRTASAAIVNVCREYAEYLRSGGSTVELPDPEPQWLRLSTDIFTQLGERFPEAVSASFARLIAGNTFLLQAQDPISASAELRIQRLERELRRVYRSGSWRLTAPLRMVSKKLRRIAGG